jgi:hypothetical protein
MKNKQNGEKATKLLSVRPNEQTLAALNRRINNSVSSVHQVADRDLERYYNLLKYALREVSLTEQEAMLVCDALNGVFFDDFSIRLMHASVEDALKFDGLAEKWEVDRDKLIGKLRSYSTGALYSIADAVEQWWNLNDESFSNTQKLEAVGLIKN